MIDRDKPSFYIKLGESGAWERECIRDGTLRFGYNGTPLDACLEGRWDEVAAYWLRHSPKGNAGSATRHAHQIKWFFEATPQQVFITYHDRRLWWCRPEGPVDVQADGTHVRQTVDGWHDQSIAGAPLAMTRLSGKLLKTEAFRGTVCRVDAHAYLMRKLHDELSPELEEAEQAEAALCAAVQKLIALLTWQDFELLVDLIFSTSGWRRVSATGGTQKTIDLDLVSPTTSERAFVQIKSKADGAALTRYVDLLQGSETYDRMFFVWHTGGLNEGMHQDGVVMVGPQRLARMVVDAGLSSWVRDKVG